MSSWIGSWLAGTPRSARDTAGLDAQARPTQRYRGERLGLPGNGPDSVASLGRRLAALLIDCVLASLVTALFVHPQFARPDRMLVFNYWSMFTWLVITVVATAFFAATPGMTLLGLRVARTDGVAVLGPIRAALRAVLIIVVVPAVIWDADGRGLHDRAASTIVLNAR